MSLEGRTWSVGSWGMGLCDYGGFPGSLPRSVKTAADGLLMPVLTVIVYQGAVGLDNRGYGHAAAGPVVSAGVDRVSDEDFNEVEYGHKDDEAHECDVRVVTDDRNVSHWLEVSEVGVDTGGEAGGGPEGVDTPTELAGLA